jgi:hypothetical protein
MKKNICYKVFAISLLLFCNSVNLFSQTDSFDYQDGIYVEIRPDTTNSARYTEDNEIYRAENIYYFTYTYKDKSNNEFYFSRLPDRTWEFIPKEAMKDSAFAIVGFFLKILPDLNGFEDPPGYDQTVIKYTYMMNNEKKAPFSESTGLIENSMNIWLHPPRTDLFEILELNPFPFIQKPYKKGNKWEWSLGIGDFWGDARWKTWEGSITNQYKYVITDTNSLVQTPLGALTCYKIKATAKSRIGKTHLIAYFNKTYGFVKLEYTNIDKSTITILLNDVNLSSKK